MRGQSTWQKVFGRRLLPLLLVLTTVLSNSFGEDKSLTEDPTGSKRRRSNSAHSRRSGIRPARGWQLLCPLLAASRVTQSASLRGEPRARLTGPGPPSSPRHLSATTTPTPRPDPTQAKHSAAPGPGSGRLGPVHSSPSPNRLLEPAPSPGPTAPCLPRLRRSAAPCSRQTL